MTQPSGHIVRVDELPTAFPTQLHSSEFWSALGRAVGTFGFLEETLGKAIYSFTATRLYEQSEIEKAYENWLPTLQRALSDQLGSLIETYAKVVRDHGGANIDDFSGLIADLKDTTILRNVICHGSWKAPDSRGRSFPLFFNRKNEKFDTPIDVVYLVSLQQRTARLIYAVINSVTHMGWSFPGSNGPGQPIMRTDH